MSLEQKHLKNLYVKLLEIADGVLSDKDLIPKIKIDLEINPKKIDMKLAKDIVKLEPYGLGNPKPVFVAYNIEIKDMRMLGEKQNHLKLFLYDLGSEKAFSAIGFDMKEIARDLSIGDKIDIVFYIDINAWNGSENVDLKILDLKKTE